MKHKRLHTCQIFAIFLLWVFSIALVPWSSVHQDEEQQVSCMHGSKICTHHAHVGNEVHNCLICSVHFIKDYCKNAISFQVILEGKVVVKTDRLETTSYTALIRSSLRGPPIA